ncbi:MAG: extracellular solute-binding protein [Streptosporangiaceae bacterium]|nr:extracellular solute-binding protein [Streptosporangiaceae bacterium]
MRTSPTIRLRRSRRVIPALSILSFLALSAAACGGGSSSGSAGSPTSANITWWGWTPSTQVAQQYISAFNKVYPNIHVTYKMLTIAGYNAALRPALASSVGPDIFDVAPGAANGSVETYSPDAINLEPAVVKALGSDWQSKLSPIGVSSLMIGQKLAAVSVGAVYSGTVWINQNLFSQYHLTPPTTLAQWVSNCATFKAHGIGCFVQGVGQPAFNEDTVQAISDNIQPGVWAQAIQGQVPWTSPVIVKALTIWKEMFSDGIMEKGALGVQQYPDANNDFMSGKYAMVMMGTWYMQYDTAPGMSAAISAAGISSPKNFTALPIAFPDVAGTGHTGALYGDSDYGIAVNAKSGHQAAATTFAVWLGTSTAGQEQVANALDDIAALKGVQPNWSQINLVTPSVQQTALSKLITNAVASTEPRLATVSVNLQTAIGNATTTVASGSATPAQAAATLQAAAAKLPNHGAV